MVDPEIFESAVRNDVISTYAAYSIYCDRRGSGLAQVDTGRLSTRRRVMQVTCSEKEHKYLVSDITLSVQR